MMKTKLLFAGLVASAALVGCTNDELFETQQAAPSVAKGETTLVFNGLGGIDTRMTYDGEYFLWQADATDKTKADQIGVRRISGLEVITNTMFWACGTSDKNEGDPETDWTGTKGKYAFFKSNDETLHEADYIVTYPYDKESVQDGKVTGKLNTAQVVTSDAGTDNTYAGEYNFMMSTATHMQGGQSTEDFDLYPVFTRLAFNITQSTNKTEPVKLQSIILKSKDGKAIFPTKLEVNADVKVTSEGRLDEASMKALTDDMADEIVLTMKDEDAVLSNDPNKAVTRYMTIIPGTYEGLVVEFITNQGTYTYTAWSEKKMEAKTGRVHNVNINIPTLKANRDYVVASATDWKQALSNIKDLKAADADNVTIKVVKDITLPAEDLRAYSSVADQKLTVFGEGSITIDGDWKKHTGVIPDNTLATTEFQVPVTVTGDFEGMVEGENLTFSELNVEGNFKPEGSNFASLTVNSGVVEGTTTYSNGNAEGALTMSNVEFAGLVTVDALDAATAYDADEETTKVNFNNCTFESGLTVSNSMANNYAAVATVNGGKIVNKDGTATLTVGDPSFTATAVKENTVYVKGNVTADNVMISRNGNAGGKHVLDVIGNLTVNKNLSNEGTTNVLFYIEQDASVTIGQNAIYEVTANATTMGETWIEGALNNYGIVVIADNAKVQDSDLNNTNRGKLNNYGLLYAPVTEWYEDQRIVLTNSANSVYAITNVDDVDAFEAALEVEGVNGVQLTGTSYVFEAESDYSNVNLYASGANISMQAPKCVFGNLTIQNDAKLTLDNGETAATIIKNTVDVYGELVIDNDLTDKKETTLESVYFYANKGSKVTNLRKAIVENGWGLQEGADITM